MDGKLKTAFLTTAAGAYLLTNVGGAYAHGIQGQFDTPNAPLPLKQILGPLMSGTVGSSIATVQLTSISDTMLFRTIDLPPVPGPKITLG